MLPEPTPHPSCPPSALHGVRLPPASLSFRLPRLRRTPQRSPNLSAGLDAWIPRSGASLGVSRALAAAGAAATPRRVQPRPPSHRQGPSSARPHPPFDSERPAPLAAPSPRARLSVTLGLAAVSTGLAVGTARRRGATLSKVVVRLCGGCVSRSASGRPSPSGPSLVQPRMSPLARSSRLAPAGLPQRSSISSRRETLGGECARHLAGAQLSSSAPIAHAVGRRPVIASLLTPRPRALRLRARRIAPRRRSPTRTFRNSMRVWKVTCRSAPPPVSGCFV